jgi:pimeloyl-ACP methyl ester carboxylesterase
MMDKIMKKYLFFIFIFWGWNLLPQLQIPAYYEGYLIQSEDSIFISLKIDTTKNKYFAFLTVPEQMVKDIKSSPFLLGETTVISFSSILAKYVASMSSSRMEGYWKQSGEDIPLTLISTPADKAFRIKRPQQISLDTIPYVIKNVRFSSQKNILLYGQFFLPDTLSAHPAVIMVTGSGPQNMYEEIADHKPFLVIADYLVRRGIGVLLYNERGVYPSTGDFNKATTWDFLEDALAGIQFIKKQSFVNPKKIGIIGHSEGGLIATLASVKSKDLSFAISIGGVFIPCRHVIPHQLEKMLSFKKIPDSVRSAMVEYVELTIQAILQHKNEKQFQKMVKSNLEKVKSKLTLEEIKKYHFDAFCNSMLVMLNDPWTKTFLTIDPSQYVSKIRIPFLAMWGEKDLQVLPIENVQALEKHLNPHSKDLLTIQIFPHLNHLMQPCKTGLPAEYMIIDTTFSVKPLHFMSEWIQKLK